ncbi:MAG: VOC family protein [Candidatus Acidiferrales bacterium]
MTKNINPVPEGFHTATPYLVVPGVAKLIDFLKQAFDAQEIQRHQRPDGSVQHAEVRIGDSIIMMGEPLPPQKHMPAMILLYVADVDALYQRALKAGATSVRAPADQPYGDRTGGVEDASGNQWWVAARLTKPD